MIDPRSRAIREFLTGRPVSLGDGSYRVPPSARKLTLPERTHVVAPHAATGAYVCSCKSKQPTCKHVTAVRRYRERDRD